MDCVPDCDVATNTVSTIDSMLAVAVSVLFCVHLFVTTVSNAVLVALDAGADNSWIVQKQYEAGQYVTGTVQNVTTVAQVAAAESQHGQVRWLVMRG